MENVLQTLGFILIDDSYMYTDPNPFDLITSLPTIRAAIEEISDRNLPAEERAKKQELKVNLF